MDLEPERVRARLPRRGARLAGRATCRPSRCRRWTPPRASPPTRSGRRGSPTPAGRWCRGREEYHGREASLVEWVIFEEEYYRAGAPGRVCQNGIFLLAPIIFDHGTPEQQDRFLPTMATGERIWAQCWSEPEAGSDLASLRSTARRDDERGGWVLNGQKTWSSRAAYAHWGFGLFRSDPEAERHRGLTYFLLPPRRRGRHRAADRPARRRGRLRRGLLRRRLRARLRRARRARRRLAGRDVHRRQRARALAALPRALLRGRGPAGRAVPRARRAVRAQATASSTPGSRPRPTGSTPGARSPGSPPAATWARRAR